MIKVYRSNETFFDGNGLATLLPTMCKVTEQAGGLFELEMEHPVTTDGRWKYLTEDALIVAPVPNVPLNAEQIAQANASAAAASGGSADYNQITIPTAYGSGQVTVPYSYDPDSAAQSVLIKVGWNLDNYVTSLSLSITPVGQTFISYKIESSDYDGTKVNLSGLTANEPYSIALPTELYQGKKKGGFNLRLYASRYTNGRYRDINLIGTATESTTGTANAKVRQFANNTGTSASALLRSAPSLDASIVAVIGNDETWYDLGTENSRFHKARTRSGLVGFVYTPDSTVVGSEAVSMNQEYATTLTTKQQWREQPFRIYKVELDTEKNNVSVKARHMSYDFLGAITGPLNIENPMDYAGVIAAFRAGEFWGQYDSKYNCGIVCGLNGGDYTGDLSYHNGIQMLLDPDVGVVQKARARVYRDKRNFFIIPDGTTDRGVRISYGRNLKGIKWTKDNTNVVTRIIPVGQDAEGNDLLLPERFVDSPILVRLPTVKMAKIDVPDAKEVAADSKNADVVPVSQAECFQMMREAAQKELDNGCDTATLELDVTFTMLGDTEEYQQYKQLEQVFLYDTVHIAHAPTGFSTTARVSAYEWDCITRRYDKITIGDVFKVDSGTIPSYQIPSGAITGAKIATGAVGMNNLADASITTAKIASAGIDVAKIGNLVATIASMIRLQVGQVSADVLDTQIADIIEANITDAQISSLQAEVMSAVGAQIQAATIDAAKITNLDAYAATIAQGIITNATIDAAKVNNLDTQTATIVTALIKKVVAESADVQELTAQLAAFVSAEIGKAKITSAQISDAQITTAQISDLNANVATIKDGKIDNATIDTAKINDLSAKVATIEDGKINNATVDWASLSTTIGQTAIIAKFLGDKMYIDQLAVNSAQMVDLMVGQLCVKASDGKYYNLDVDLDTGFVSATETTVTAAEEQAGQTTGGKHIIESSLTAQELNATSITAVEALISKITAGRIDVDELFARDATIRNLTTGRIAAALGESLDLASNDSVRLVAENAYKKLEVGGRNFLRHTTNEPTPLIETIKLGEADLSKYDNEWVSFRVYIDPQSDGRYKAVLRVAWNNGQTATLGLLELGEGILGNETPEYVEMMAEDEPGTAQAGENMLLDSAEVAMTWTHFSMPATGSLYNHTLIGESESVLLSERGRNAFVEGAKVTLSFDYDSSSDIYTLTSSSMYRLASIELAGKSVPISQAHVSGKHVAVTFTLTAAQVAAVEQGAVFTFRMDRYNMPQAYDITTNEFNVSNFKLEVGETDTEWTPAPEVESYDSGWVTVNFKPSDPDCTVEAWLVGTGSATYHSPKLEMGAVTTQWTAAPEDDEERYEDIEERLANAELAVKPESIEATVTTVVTNKMADAAPAIVKIASTRGTCFKSDQMSTDLVVTVLWNGQTIGDIATLRATFGAGTYLQWEWYKSSDADDEHGEPVYTALAVTNSHISRDGFVFTVTPSDVDEAITFRCSLVLPD